MTLAAIEQIRQAENREPWITVATRMPGSLKRELELAAVATSRSLSGEVRRRLATAVAERAAADRIHRKLRMVLTALKAKVPHELIERMIELDDPPEGT